MEGVCIYDNIVGVAYGCSPDSTNVDSIQIEKCMIFGNKVAVATGTDQARACILRDTDIEGAVTGVSCSSYGQGIGVLPEIEGGSNIVVKWLIDCNNGGRGRGIIDSVYCENTHAIGYFGTGYGLEINNCTFKLLTTKDNLNGNGASTPRLMTLQSKSPATFLGGEVTAYNGNPERHYIANGGMLTIAGTSFDNQPLFTDQYSVNIVSMPNGYTGKGYAYSTKMYDNATANSRGFYVPGGGTVLNYFGEQYTKAPGTPEGFSQFEASATITNYGDGTGSFVSADSTVYTVGTYITGQGGSAGYNAQVADGRIFNVASSSDGCYIGKITAINPSTNLVTLGEMMAEVKSGSMNILRRELPMFHSRSFGTTSSGANTITSVGNIGTWAVGDLISITKDDGSNVGPTGATVASITTTTSQLVGSAGSPVAMTTSGGATLNGYIDNGALSAGNKLTVVSGLVGTITVGHFLTGAGVAAGTIISAGSSSPYTLGASNMTISRNVSTSNTNAKLSYANMAMTKSLSSSTYNSTGAVGIGVAWKGDFINAVNVPAGSSLTGWLCTATGNPGTWTPVYGNSNTILVPLGTLSTKASDAAVGYAIAPMGYKVLTVYAVLNGALATADGTATFAINGTNITNGAITLTNAGSAAGVKYSASPTALNTGAAGDVIRVTIGGGSTATATGNFYAVLVANP